MFTSDAASAIRTVFQWIYSFINITIPGLTVTLWQLALGLFLFRLVWRIALSLTNTTSLGVSYKSSSYHKEQTYEQYEKDRERQERYNSLYKERHQ